MPIANGPDELLHSLIELRRGDARRRFRKSIFEDYPLKGPFGQCACAYCGKWNEKLTIDHIIPKSKGGPHFERANLAPSCFACNSSKSNSDLWTWWSDQEFWSFFRADILTIWMNCRLLPNENINQFQQEPSCCFNKYSDAA
jgi:hypothetical protein